MSQFSTSSWTLYQLGEPGKPLNNLSKFIQRSNNNKKGDPSRSRDLTYNIEALEESLISLVQNNPSLNEFHIMPNFNFGYLYPPTGWTAKLNREMLFNHDLFMGEECFRCITIVEINKAINDHEHFRQVCLQCIPTKITSNYISFRDNSGSGWTPVFSPRGNALGYFTFQDHDESTNEGVERHFLICDNSLPDQTLNDIQSMFIREGVKSQQSLLVNIPTGSDSQPLSNMEMFGHENRLGTLKECASEQNRRILTILIKALSFHQGIHALNTPIVPHFERHPPHEDSFATNEPYRAIESKVKVTHEQLMELLENSIYNWPVGAPVYPFSVNNETGFPFGSYIHGLSQVIANGLENSMVAQQIISDIKNKYPWFEFIKSPLTLTPLVENIYNTFDFDLNGDIIWRSNNTNCQNINGVIKKRPISMGYEVWNPSFCISHKRKDWEIKGHLNSHPIIDPFEVDETKVISDDLLRKFFAVETPPNQLKGSFLQDVTSINVQSVLYPQEFHKICLEPKIVYLSSGIQARPRFELSLS